MEYIAVFFQFILHLNQNLAIFVHNYGSWVYLLLFIIVFCQTGVVLTAFLPGDSLLFASGALAATGALNVYGLIVLFGCAAFLGNTVNFWVGYWFGHLLFQKEDSLFFKKSYLNKTHAFFEKYGSKAIVLALFVPVIRTFTPFVAGMGNMNHFKFMLFNFLGVMFWVLLLVGLSFWFGNIPAVKSNFTWVILAIIVLSILPPFIEYFRVKSRKN